MGDTRYGPVRYALTGDRERARTFLPLARNALLRLQERQRMTKVLSWTDVVDLAPGVACTIRLAGDIASVFVHAEPEERVVVTVPVPRPGLWVPRGFVLLPVSETAPDGWGFPAVQIGDDPFSVDNLNPGLDVDRWTLGGRCGQVLLTRVTDAGYPTEAERPPPLMFHADFGPSPDKNDDGDILVNLPPLNSLWRAFRPSFVDFTTYEDSQAEWKRESFSLLNEHRQGIGLDPVSPPFRGYYDGAQVTADQIIDSSVFGHFSSSFDTSYKSMVDRLTKDGVISVVPRSLADSRSEGSPGLSSEIIYGKGTDFQAIGVDPNGVPIYTFVPGDTPSPEEAMNAWLGSPPHKAVIESTDWNAGGVVDIGVRSGVAVQHFSYRDEWVSAGNRSWTGNDGVTVSWHGFPTLNLFGETWPVSFNFTKLFADGLALFTTHGNPIPVEQLDATYLSCPVNGMFADDYWAIWAFRVTHSERHETYVRTMDNRIYCRGRAIALAPRGSAVLAAAMQEIGGGAIRLIALTHDDADQPGDWRSHGLTSILRVWYCDIQNVSDLTGNAQSVIRGVYGDPTSYPWEDAPDEWSWKGGATVDVGTTGSARDLLKYASQWVMSRDGTSAVCMRQKGTAQDIEASYRSLYIDEHDNFTMAGALSINPVFRNYTDFVVVQLDLSDPEAPVMSQLPLSEVNSVVPGSEMSTPYTEAYCQPPAWQLKKSPLSVGFSSSGQLTTCWIVSYHVPNYNCGPTTRVTVRFVGFTPGTAAPDHSQMLRVNEYPAANNSAPGPILFENAWVPQVLSHTSQAFCYIGTWPDHACWRDSGASIHEVSLIVNGARVATRRLPSFDNTTPFVAPFCLNYVEGGLLQTLTPGPVIATTTCNYLVPSFAENADGEWVASLRIAPQLTGDVYVAGEATVDCVGGISCSPVWKDVSHLVGYPGIKYVSVVTAASFMSAAAMADVTGTPSAELETMYVRTV